MTRGSTYKQEDCGKNSRCGLLKGITRVRPHLVITFIFIAIRFSSAPSATHCWAALQPLTARPFTPLGLPWRC
eukprot:6477270-Amphidinium_carterae.1